MIHLHEIRFAHVHLIIGDKDLNFYWCAKDLRELRNKYQRLIQNPTPHQNNLSDTDSQSGVVTGDEDIENEENDSDIWIPDPFLSDGKWNPLHIRRIIHVLDNFQISHDSYHELRMTSRSILPPLSRIKKEKCSMSKDINYYKSGTVKINVNSFILLHSIIIFHYF